MQGYSQPGEQELIHGYIQVGLNQIEMQGYSQPGEQELIYGYIQVGLNQVEVRGYNQPGEQELIQTNHSLNLYFARQIKKLVLAPLLQCFLRWYHPSIHLFTYSSTHPFILVSISLFINSSIHPCIYLLFIYSSIFSCIYLSIHLLIHSFAIYLSTQ